MVTAKDGKGRRDRDVTSSPRVSPGSADFSPRQVREAVEVDFADMVEAGALRADSATLQAAARRLADRIDHPSPLDSLSMLAAAVRELRAVMADLRVEVIEDDDDKFFAGLAAVPTPVRDATKSRSPHSRAKGGRGDGGVGVSSDAVAAARPRRVAGARTG